MIALIPILVLAFGIIVSTASTALMRRISVRVDFVDTPGGHKGHAVPVALGGGVAVTMTVVIGILGGLAAAFGLTDRLGIELPDAIAIHLPGMQSKAPVAIAICVAAVALCLIGLADDRRPLSALLRFGAQLVVAATLVIAFDLRLLTRLPDAASIALSILWIMLLTNSMNFLDNMDGLASGVAIIAASIFALAAASAGQIFVPCCCWLLAGALLGFLPFNFHPARIYLGDAGSTVVGLLLAVFTILTTFAAPAEGDQPIGVIAPLIVMAVPLYDTASVFLLRWRAGVPIWRGDRRHFSHRLVRRGMTVPRAVLLIWLATLVTAMPALLLARTDWMGAMIILTQTILVVLLVALLESSGRHADG